MIDEVAGSDKVRFGDLKPGQIFSQTAHGPHKNVKASITYPPGTPEDMMGNAVSLTDGRVRTYTASERVYVRKLS